MNNYNRIYYLFLFFAFFSLGAKVQKLQKADDLNTHLKSGKPTLLLFTSDGCGPCMVMKPVYEQLAAENTDVNFICCHGAEPASSLRKKYNAQSSPTLVIFDAQGKNIDTIVGGPMTPKDAHLDLSGSIAQAKGTPLITTPSMMSQMQPAQPMQQQAVQTTAQPRQQKVSRTPQPTMQQQDVMPAVQSQQQMSAMPAQKKQTRASRTQKNANPMEAPMQTQLAANQPQDQARRQRINPQPNQQPRESRFQTREYRRPEKKPVQ